MQAQLNWQGKLQFAGKTDSGHELILNGSADPDSQAAGPSPMELLLLSVGGCSSIDVVHILERSRQQVTDCHTQVSGTRAETAPKVFTDIHLHFVVSGPDLAEKQVARAVQLSAEKYCSASIMLAGKVNITHDFEIVAT